MPLKLDVKRKFSQRSERVKGVDLHPTEPWILGNLYTGHVCIWNYADGTMVKSFETADVPARCAKFVARKQWVVIGSDDMFIRVYNYNTMDRVKMFEAHGDYIRSVAVHPSLPYILSCSDDMLIKLWDWDKNFACTQIFEGHVHYVMQVTFNPKDTSTFASASLDRTVKVWSIGQPAPNFTLEGHEKGVNAVDYFTGGDRPYLISGADDKTAKVWDYQTKACVQTLEGHSNNVSAVVFHPELPVILTGSEDGCIKIWHATTYRMESSINYGMERVWSIGVCRGTNSVTVGYDEGVVLMKMGSEEPVASMDASGRIIYARHNDVHTAVIKALGADYELVDGERLPLPIKDLGSSEIFPGVIKHNANGRFVAVLGDGEYIIYTALAWRNKSFGSAADFAWSTEQNDFATREGGSSTVKLHKNFKEAGTIDLGFTPDGMHGGALLAVRAAEHISFYDWDARQCVRRIDVAAENVYWNPAGDMLAVVCKDSFYVLQYNRDAVTAAVAGGAKIDEDGVEDAFEVVTEVEDRVSTGLWVGDCFVFSNASWRLNYCVGGEVTVMFHLDRPLFLLGYIAAQQRIYLIDREHSIVSYTLLLALVEFKTLVMRGETDDAYDMIPSLPEDQLDGVAKFLEGRGDVAKALEVARDADYRFDLAVQLNDFDVAVGIAEELASPARWKQLGEMALSDGRLPLAQRCLSHSGDLSGMMLMFTATGNRTGMRDLCDQARAANKFNVAFLGYFMLQDADACLDVLVACGRLPEAAFFARTYRPSRCSEMLSLWRTDLRSVNGRAAEALADPAEYGNLFPDWQEALEVEAAWEASQTSGAKPASAYPAYADARSRDLIALAKEGKPLFESGAVPSAPAPAAPAAAAAGSAAPAAAPAPSGASPVDTANNGQVDVDDDEEEEEEVEIEEEVEVEVEEEVDEDEFLDGEEDAADDDEDDDGWGV